VAFEVGTERLTYCELDQRANGLAAALAEAGATLGTVTPIVLGRGLALPVAILAVLKAGGAMLYIDPADPAERRDVLLERVRPAALIAGADYRGGSPKGARRFDADAWLAESRGAVRAPPNPGDGSSLAQLLPTSGSTGTPKLVMRTHRMLAGQLLYEQGSLGHRASDRHLFKFPASFRESVLPALAGGTAVIVEPGGHRDCNYLARFIRERGITVASFVPSVLKDLLREPETAACKELRQVSVGGELMSGEIARRFHATLGARLQSTYTMTEADYVCSWACVPDHGRPDGWLGRETNMRIFVLDEALRPVAAGEVGEIMVAGPALALGYFRDPAATADRFRPNPAGPEGSRLFRSGDLGRRLDDGVTYAGRTDDQVKIGGQRIDLGEVETALLSLRDVADVAVSAWTSPDGGPRLVAHIVGQAADTVGPGLRAALVERLPGHMIPSHFVRCEALPRLPNGKLDRRALPPPPRIRPALTSSYAAPATPTQIRVAGLWADALWVDQVGLDDRFFDLGGTSLLAMQARTRLSAEFGIPLSMAELLIHPTVRELAGRIDERLGVADAALGGENGEEGRAARRRRAFAARGRGGCDD
jgi:amino acid adenylation domain-containing protein